MMDESSGLLPGRETVQEKMHCDFMKPLPSTEEHPMLVPAVRSGWPVEPAQGHPPAIWYEGVRYAQFLMLNVRIIAAGQ